MDTENARRFNRAAVLEAVFANTGPTRAALGQSTGLSAATVSRVVDDLLAEGILTEGALIAAGGRGRPTRAIDLSAQAGCVMGLDMGLSTTTSTFVDLQGRLVGEDRSLTAIAGSTRSMVTKTASYIARMRDRHDITLPLVGLTISVPAVVTTSNEVLSAADGIDLMGGAFRERLEDRVGVGVQLINDARASLIGESWRGAAAGSTNASLLMLSTTVGVAAMVSGEVLPQRSPNSRSYDSLPIGHARVGDYLSTRGLRPLLPVLTTETPDYTVVHTDPAHAQCARHFLTAAVLLTATAAIAYDSDVVIFTGRLSELTRMTLPDIRREIEQVLPQSPRLVMSEMRGRAGAFGAAYEAMVHARRQLTGRPAGSEDVSATHTAAPAHRPPDNRHRPAKGTS